MIEEPTLIAETKHWINLLYFLLPKLAFFYPIACGALAALYRCSGADRTMSCTFKNGFGHFIKYTGVAYLSVFVFLYYFDTDISNILKDDMLFYGFTAFVLSVPLFFEVIVSSALFKKLFALFIVKWLGLKEKEKEMS